MQLEPTGERLIVEHAQSSPEGFALYLIHVATYRFAESYTRGKRVLDFGSGSGYGSALIAETAKSVIGVDVAQDAVDHAREHYVRDNLAYECIVPDATLPFADASFDTVLSFQVLEHVGDTALYLSEIRRVLAPGGCLVLATPDSSTRLLPLQRPWNRWHLHEYAGPELERLLSRHFAQVEVLGMTATPELLEVELRRARRAKWMLLPVTLPIMPDRWRVAALNLVHRIRGPAPPSPPPARPFHWDVFDVIIRKDVAPSTNLVAVALKEAGACAGETDHPGAMPQ